MSVSSFSLLGAALQPGVLQEAPYVRDGFGQHLYDNQTNLHPVALGVLIVLGLATLLARRRNALIPIVLMACFVPQSQRIVIATLDFTMLRLMVLVCVLRISTRGEARALRFGPLDSLVLAWAMVSFAAYCTLRGTVSAFVFQTGLIFDQLGFYFVFRCLLRDWQDLDRLSWMASWAAIVSLPFFVVENLTGRNVFAFFGGVSPFTIVREGRMRCQGPFAHAIMAGCFWAVLLPLVASRWWRPGGKALAVASSTAILGIVYCSASSTPVFAVAAAILGAGMFTMRRHMRLARWTAVVFIVIVHFAREQPVWHLISRISAVGGSTSYHRYRLIDAAIRQFPEWALLGTESTAHWGWYLFDVTNHYVGEAVRGGALTLALFLAYIVVSFGTVGRLWRAQRGSRYRTAMAWALGVSLFAHCSMFMGVSNFAEQGLCIWFLVVAALGSLGSSAAVAVGRRKRGRSRALGRRSPAALSASGARERGQVIDQKRVGSEVALRYDLASDDGRALQT